jgi:phosphatidylglycerol:prolipoprotein diacylglycerol transferase
MLPVIFRLGPFTLYSFGLLLFLGTLSGLFVIWKKTREEHYDETDVFDVVLSIGLWSMVGARILYVVLHASQYGFNVLDWFNIFGKPGFSFLGGLVAGVMALWKEAKKRKWDFYEFSDFVVIGVTLTLIFGWLGAFLNGSSLGLPTESVLGIRFAGMFDKRHPVQLYAFVMHIIFFIYVLWAESRFRTFDWYRAGKSGVKSGFLLFNFILFLGISNVVLAVFSPPQFVFRYIVLDWYVWGMMIVLGITGLYARSGRELSREFSGLSLSKRRERIEKRRERRTNV